MRTATKKEQEDYYEQFIINRIPVSEEQFNRIKNMPQLSDEEIDLSDIPEITKEEWRTNFKPAGLRKKI